MATHGFVLCRGSLSDVEIQQQLDLNLLGPMHVTRSFLPAWRARRSGTFIHITSIGGRVGFATGALYHAAKFALEGFAEAVNEELAEFGVKTLIIEPGSMKTDFVSNIRWAQELDAYKDGVVGKLRQWIKQSGDEYASGNPAKMAEAIYDLSQQDKPPLRTALGADAYEVLERSYSQSLQTLQSQKVLAQAMAFEGKSGFVPK